MKEKRVGLGASILFLFLLVSTHSVFAEEQIKRYALIVGANNGGNERVLLKYAVSDAAAFREVMTTLGGIEREDAFVLYNPDKRNYYSAVNKLYQKIKADSDQYRKKEFFFYYSGHSDTTGILLGNEKLSYKELKQNIKKFDVDVRIAILDSCQSGAFTRTKGGSMKPSFLVDSSYDMKGNAFMTSSSADEASQESDNIKGSFFTHYIITGMRGAADVSQDKKITLNEVYQFAYNSTLTRTQKTTGGPQHPNYHIEMIGTGDVVLTDVNSSSSKLIVADELEGKMLVRDGSGYLVAEFTKSYGQEVVLGVGAGSYTVTNNSFDGKVAEAELDIGEGANYTLKKNEFSQASKERTRERGETQSSSNFFNRLDDEMDTLFEGDGDGGEYLLKSGELTFSGYGGPALFVNKVKDEAGLWVGGKGGVIINDSFVFGGGGYGLTTPRDLDVYTNMQRAEDEEYLNIGFGGVLFEYYLYPKSLVTYSFGFLIGAGGYSYSGSIEDEDYDSDSAQSDGEFFAFHPTVAAYINFTRFFRMGLGVSYNFFSGISSDYIKDEDFNGLCAKMLFEFGWF